MKQKVYDVEKVQQEILNTIQKLYDTVSSTLGPKGRNVLLYKNGSSPIITKDGVSIAKFINSDDPLENSILQTLKQAAIETEKTSGDGTTTSTILAYHIYKKAQKYIVNGVSPIELKRGVDKAVDKIIEKLKGISKPIRDIKDIEHIATISANGDKEIGQMIANAVDMVGKDGSIVIEDARSNATSLDFIEGFRFSSGYMSTQFVTDERKGFVKYSDPLILVTNHKIEFAEELKTILEYAHRESRPLVIVCDDMEKQALATLIINCIRGSLKCVAIKAPEYGETRQNILSDLCLATGATFITRDSGIRLKELELKHLGNCKSIEIVKNQTTVIGGKGNTQKIDERIEFLNQQIKQTDSIKECEKIQERITKLASGVAIVYVGASTEIEMIEKRHRIEDALEAVKSAQEEGVVVGGGAALLRVLRDFSLEVDSEEQKYGVSLMREVIKEPFKKILENAGISSDFVINEFNSLLDKEQIGFDVVNKEFCDMFIKGIIDPVKVTKNALKNASSVAMQLVMVKSAICEE